MCWISTVEAAKRVGCSTNGIRYLYRRGELTGKEEQVGKRLLLKLCPWSVHAYVNSEPKPNSWRTKKMAKIAKRVPLRDKGYVLIYRPGHLRANCDGYVYEHMLVMEAYLRRSLTEVETVHHKNRIRSDNRIENLALYASRSEHMKLAHGEVREGLSKLGRELNAP